ncbi:MAG: hypothetical protein R3E96_10740 [Planctomycetota bacterium]
MQWQENSNHVVHGTAPAAGTTFEGFRVVGGNADSGLTSGGGLAVEGGELLVRHCEFVRNRGAAGGGGMALIDCTASVERCTFVENRGDQQGGGALVAGPAATVWRECRFEANTGGQGSGLSVGPSTFFASDSSEPLIEDCDFIGNIGQVGATGGGDCTSTGPWRPTCAIAGLLPIALTAAEVCTCAARWPRWIAATSSAMRSMAMAGAIYFDNFDGLVTWVPLVRNCVMIGNTGALACIDMSAELVHCTVADNLLPGAGPGLSWPAMFVWNGQILLRQSIVWGHLPQGNNGDERDHLLAFGTGGYGIENCIIEAWQGVLPGTATGSDPQFVDPLGPDGDRFEFADNRYELAATSPGLDAGDIGALGSGILTDAYGRDRYRDGNADTIDQADLGGLERMRPTDFGTSDCGGSRATRAGATLGSRPRAPRQSRRTTCGCGATTCRRASLPWCSARAAKPRWRTREDRSAPCAWAAAGRSGATIGPARSCSRAGRASCGSTSTGPICLGPRGRRWRCRGRPGASSSGTATSSRGSVRCRTSARPCR